MSAPHLDALLTPEQECVVDVAALALRRFREAVLPEADRIEATAARTDAVPDAIEVQRLDTPSTAHIDERLSNPTNERNHSMQTRHDTIRTRTPMQATPRRIVSTTLRTTREIRSFALAPSAIRTHEMLGGATPTARRTRAATRFACASAIPM